MMKNDLVSLINEKTELIERINLSKNVVIIAPYNFGKESLINYSIQKASVETEIVSISLNVLFSVSEDEFLCKYASEILNSLKAISKDSLESYLRTMSSLEIFYNIEATENASYKISVSACTAPFSTLQKEEILNLPEKIAKEKKIDLLICLSEFQSVLSWNKIKPSFLDLFHEIAKRQNHVRYCISGSHIYQMNKLFGNKNSLLYKFGHITYLEPIAKEQFSDYISKSFKKVDKVIERDLISKILNVTERNPRYTEFLFSEVLKSNNKIISHEWVENCIEILLRRYIASYKSKLSQYNVNQRLFLIALSKSNGKKIYSLDFIRKSGLEYSAKLDKVKNSLLKEGTIYTISDKTIKFTDPLFKYWLAENFD
ncbi:hypothetical protein ABWH96_03480 [Marivirga tractuosa]|jgi:hypothetical protein|uniref:hypothetical protein n=1 Tax=Marivirga tractuosa TaxID=1006 RepID=UPI0035CF4192